MEAVQEQTQQTQQVQSETTGSTESTKSTESNNMITEEDIINVFNEYVRSETKELNKSFCNQFKTCDKTIKNFNNFFQKKFYENKNLDSSDMARYTDMITCCVNQIASSESLNKYLSSPKDFYESMILFLTSEEVYSIVSEFFEKKSFKLIGEKITRIFNPKEDDEPLDGMENVTQWIKSYGSNFIDMFNCTFSKCESYIYTFAIGMTKNDDSHEILKTLVHDLCEKERLYFGAFVEIIVNDVNTLKILLASPNEMTELSKFRVDVFTAIFELQTLKYNPIFVNNFVSMHALKKAFVSKTSTVEDVVNLLNLLKKQYGLYFYEATYVDMSSFNTLQEYNLPNILKGIVKNAEDYVSGLSKQYPYGVLATLQLNGQVGNLQIKSYWVSVDPIENCVPQFDREAFNWRSIELDEFVSKMKTEGELFTEYLH